MHIPYGHESSNSFSESENSQLKRSIIGPAANHKLDRSGMANVKSTNKRFNKIQGNAINRCSQEEMNFEKRFKTDENDMICFENITKHVVNHKVETCMEQFHLSNGSYLFS